MMDATPVLRPLTIGEIFDRAVTIYVRNFALFTAIMLTLWVPFGVFNYTISRNDQGSLKTVLDRIQHPEKKAPKQTPQDAGEVFSLVAIVGLLALVAPFVNNAIAVGVAAIYNGTKPTYGAAFATVFRRFFPLLGTVFLAVVTVIALYIVCVFVLVMLTIVGALFVKVALPFAIVLFILAILAAFAVLLLFVMLAVAYAFAMYAVSLESVSPAKALGLAFARIFSRAEFRKSLLVALALFGLQLGVAVIAGTLSIVLQLVWDNDVAAIALSTIVNSLLTALTTVLLAVYYYDVRTRSEGLDLEVDLARLTAAT